MKQKKEYLIYGENSWEREGIREINLNNQYNIRIGLLSIMVDYVGWLLLANNNLLDNHFNHYFSSKRSTIFS